MSHNLIPYLTDRDSRESLEPYLELYQKNFSQQVPINTSKFSLFTYHLALKKRWLVPFIDIWSRLFDRKNPLRYQLNAIVALSENHPLASKKLLKISDSLWINRMSLALLLAGYGFLMLLSLAVVPVLYVFARLFHR